KIGRGEGGDGLISQCQTVGRAHSLLSLGPREPPPHPAGARWGFGGQAAGTEGRRMIPSLGGDPFPSLLKARCWEMERNQGPSSWLGGRDHCVVESQKAEIRSPEVLAGWPQGPLTLQGPCILIYKTRPGPLEENFLPKAVVLGHAQLWQDDLFPRDADQGYSMPQRGVKSGRSEL
ncbi:unnamed protein product, partial [Gulo gulo]